MTTTPDPRTAKKLGLMREDYDVPVPTEGWPVAHARLMTLLSEEEHKRLVAEARLERVRVASNAFLALEGGAHRNEWLVALGDLRRALRGEEAWNPATRAALSPAVAPIVDQGLPAALTTAAMLLDPENATHKEPLRTILSARDDAIAALRRKAAPAGEGG